MRALRIVLQIAIVALGLLFAFAATFGGHDSVAALGVLAFFGLVFLFTLVLREETETRLMPGRKYSSRIRGAFLAFPGTALCWIAWLTATGQPLSSGRTRQSLEALTGIFGPWPVALVLLVAGLRVLWLSYRVFRSE
jgi:hypothetical protein